MRARDAWFRGPRPCSRRCQRGSTGPRRRRRCARASLFVPLSGRHGHSQVIAARIAAAAVNAASKAEGELGECLRARARAVLVGVGSQVRAGIRAAAGARVRELGARAHALGVDSAFERATLTAASTLESLRVSTAGAAGAVTDGVAGVWGRGLGLAAAAAAPEQVQAAAVEASPVGDSRGAVESAGVRLTRLLASVGVAYDAGADVLVADARALCEARAVTRVAATAHGAVEPTLGAASVAAAARGSAEAREWASGQAKQFAAEFSGRVRDGTE